ncbi:MAG: fibronectin type III domain-containing protein, partial [Gammaproteobacteria bacterium]
MRILIVLLALFSTSAYAQTMVLACGSPWGASENCGGCSDLKWSAPDANDNVKADGVAYWTKLGALASTAKVSFATGKTEGSSASCSAVTGTQTASQLLTSTPSSPPAPPPSGTAGSAVIGWTAPTQCADGTPVSNCPVTGYRLEYGTNFGSSVSLAANVLTYTFTGLPAATYQGRLVTISGSQQSTAGNPFTFVVSGSQTCPAKPADVTQTNACPSGSTGSWAQSHTWSSVA